MMFIDKYIFDVDTICYVFEKDYNWLKDITNKNASLFYGEYRLTQNKFDPVYYSLEGIVKLKKLVEKEADKSNELVPSRLIELFPMLYEIGANNKRNATIIQYIAGKTVEERRL